MIAEPTFRLPSTALRFLSFVAIAGAAVFIAGLFVAPDRIWPNMLLAGYYVTGLGVAGACFLGLTYVTNAGWSAALKRVPEAMTGMLPVAAAVMLLLAFGIHTLYEWSHESVIAADKLLQGKTSWLNAPFFIVRIAVYFLIWFGLAWAMVRYSRLQDETGDIDLTRKNVRIAAISLIAFAITYCLASFDWIMSLEPHWYSTIFGLYNLSGMLVSGLSMITILVILLRRNGVFEHIITEEHLHDLGKLIFAMCTFWMYIWFSQYMLIWYANIPEETTYFILRESGSWLTFSVLNVIFNWAIPFAVLLSHKAKRNEGLMLKICILLLIGHWVDLYWMIMPPFMKAAPRFSIWEVGPLAGLIAVFFIVTLRTLARRKVVPVNDPMLVESLHYHS